MKNHNNIAIIGSGISGLVCAYKLTKQGYNVTLFEKNSSCGGHAKTILHKDTPIDIGFMVFNKKTYPSFVNLLEELDIETKCSDMSFSFVNVDKDISYNGKNIFTMFYQKNNFFKLWYYKFLYEIIKFNKIVKSRKWKNNQQQSLKEFVKQNNFSKKFTSFYLYPLCSAIWSTEQKIIEQFPIKFLFEFMINHALVQLKNRPQWMTIKNGSKQYVSKIITKIKDQNAIIKNNVEIIKIHFDQKTQTYQLISENKKFNNFNKVILACHSDQAKKLIQDINPQSAQILDKIKYQKNQVVLHTDESIMPKRKGLWASWNYHQRNDSSTELSYFINNLQSINSKKNYFVSINPFSKIKQNKVIYKCILSHPIFNHAVIDAQKTIHQLNGKDNLYFAGAYMRYGFHEDGVYSAEQVSILIDQKQDKKK